jgi:hypothetical protein
MEITLKIELNEVNAILDAIGTLPTSTNIWPLAAKIRAQTKEQLPKQEHEDVGQAATAD